MSKFKADPNNKDHISEGQERELMHLAETTDLSPKQARYLFKRHGADWEKIRKEAENYKAES